MTPNEVMNTPAGLLDKMMAAENVYISVQEFESLPPNRVIDWINQNPDKWKLVTEVNGW